MSSISLGAHSRRMASVVSLRSLIGLSTDEAIRLMDMIARQWSPAFINLAGAARMSVVERVRDRVGETDWPRRN